MSTTLHPPASARATAAVTLVLPLLGAVAAISAAAAVPAQPVLPHVMVARLDTIIHPIAAQFVVAAVAKADAAHASALVLELDTPGGLMTSMREITRALLQAKTPVIAWVAPQGAQAASAGFFVLMSADVAAMAPGTNAGAAHPVGGQGEELSGTMGKKVEQDAAAQIRSLAARHGRNVELAQLAVVESRSFTAEEAQQGRLVEVVAPSLPALLRAVDGRRVVRPEGAPLILATAGASVERLEMGRGQRLLAVIAHPNVAYILLALGMLGLYFELATPGAVLPGVVGVTCLVLGFFALSVLPVSYAGIGLLVLAAAFFLAEIKLTSYGLLTTAGTLCLVLGSLMLFQSSDPALRISRGLIAGVAASAMLAALFLMSLVLRVHRTPVRTGIEGLVGELGIARSALAPAGKVFVHGELWEAVGEAPVGAGQRVEVVGLDGMTLRVRAAERAGSPAVAASGLRGG